MFYNIGLRRFTWLPLLTEKSLSILLVVLVAVLICKICRIRNSSFSISVIQKPVPADRVLKQSKNYRFQPLTPSGQWNQALDLNCRSVRIRQGLLKRGSSARSERQSHKLDVHGSNPCPAIMPRWSNGKTHPWYG